MPAVKRDRHPYPWLPTPDEVAAAPALASASALLPSLDVLIVALTAAHHELQPTADGHHVLTMSPAACAADELILAAQALAAALISYRLAALEQLASRDR